MHINIKRLRAIQTLGPPSDNERRHQYFLLLVWFNLCRRIITQNQHKYPCNTFYGVFHWLSKDSITYWTCTLGSLFPPLYPAPMSQIISPPTCDFLELFNQYKNWCSIHSFCKGHCCFVRITINVMFVCSNNFITSVSDKQKHSKNKMFDCKHNNKVPSRSCWNHDLPREVILNWANYLQG